MAATAKATNFTGSKLESYSPQRASAICRKQHTHQDALQFASKALVTRLTFRTVQKLTAFYGSNNSLRDCSNYSKHRAPESQGLLDQSMTIVQILKSQCCNFTFWHRSCNKRSSSWQAGRAPRLHKIEFGACINTR